MKDIKCPKIFLVILILALLLGLTGPVSRSVASSGAKIQPALLQLANQNPEQQVAVIVQKTDDTSHAEALAGKLGGRITKDLHIIHAFAVEIQAAAAVQLAASASVRWISLDAPVNQSDVTATFTTWAMGIGTSTPNAFTSPENMMDSPLGSNGTFGYGASTRGAFTNFVGEVTPNHQITQVEVVVHAYVSVPLYTGEDPKFRAFVAGEWGSSVILNHNTINRCVGLENACTVYVDITNSRTWHWNDFDHGLELVVEHARFRTGHTVYYDAIGLRVTSAPGTDTAAPLDLHTYADYIDTSNLGNAFNATVKATDLWNEAPGYLQGQGMTVALVDSGTVKNSDLGRRIIKSVNFNSNYHRATDTYGHGTFVAGILAGDGTHSNGVYMGMAPRANLINLRVSDDQGAANESDVVMALQWIYDHREQYNIRVANISLNSSLAQSYHTSPLDAAVEILWFNGVVVVVSAGNNGTTDLYPPANDPFVITVGATQDYGTPSLSDDIIASFSAYGMDEAGYTKPELVAPGANLVAYLPDHRHLNMGLLHPENFVDNHYFRMSGTSVAAPIVSGAVALLLQDDPTLSPDQVKHRLMSTAVKDASLWPSYDPTKAGAGYLDVYAAVHGDSTESANTDVTASQLLWTGSEPVAWNSVSWNSVSWNSVSWNSVSWNSVSWNSVSWNSDYWEP